MASAGLHNSEDSIIKLVLYSILDLSLVALKNSELYIYNGVFMMLLIVCIVENIFKRCQERCGHFVFSFLFICI